MNNRIEFSDWSRMYEPKNNWEPAIFALCALIVLVLWMTGRW